MVLDTLAYAQFLSGRKEEAIATQEKAVARRRKSPRLLQSCQRRLDDYRAGRTPVVE